MLSYTAIIEKGHESGYVAYCPSLKGCVAQGRTKAEALSHLRQAIKDHIECLIEDGIAVPREVAREAVRVAVETA